MSIPGLTKTTPFHYKAVNNQIGSVLIHQGMIFLVTLEGGIVCGGKPYGFPHTKLIPDCKINDAIVKSNPIDFGITQVIDGRFFGWQEGGEYWLFIQPKPDDASKSSELPYSVLYHKYRG